MKEKYLFLPPKPKFTNRIIDKKELKKLMAWAFSNYGTGRASYMADRLKELGFHYATKAGISLSVEDLRVPPTKRELLYKTNEEIKFTEQRYGRGEITAVERFQKVIDTWNNSSESLKDEVIKYFKRYKKYCTSLNYLAYEHVSTSLVLFVQPSSYIFPDCFSSSPCQDV